MSTIKLIPSTYYLSNSSYLSVSNASNMYTDVDSTTYATITNSRTSTSSYYAYIRGFNFDDVPSAAIVSDFTVRLRGYYSGGYSQNMYLYDGTSTSMGSGSSLSTSAQTIEFTCNYSWEDVVAAGSDFGIRINCRRSSRNTTAYFYILGAEIEVTYTLPVSATVTSTLTGDGTISPSGATATYEGEEYELTITPTNKSDPVTATKNGVDITSQLVSHGVGSSLSFTAESYTTSSISSGSSYASYCIGYTAENPNSSADGSNMYASSGSTGYATYSFDFSSIPSGATIEDIEVRCYGHRESSTVDSTHVSMCVLYQSSTAISEEVDFPSTSSSMITVIPTDMPTRSELDNVTLRHYVGYYGGLVEGITFVVTYSTGTGIDHYTYTYTVDGDATIAVVIGAAAQDKMDIKLNGSWVEAVKVWKKVGNGASSATTVFESNYIHIIADTQNYIWQSDFTTPFLANETYKVTWGSETYTCQTFSYGNAYDGYAIGNTSISSGGGTEPFLLYRNDADTLIGGTTTAAQSNFHLKIEKLTGGDAWVEQTDLTSVFESGVNYKLST